MPTEIFTKSTPDSFFFNKKITLFLVHLYTMGNSKLHRILYIHVYIAWEREKIMWHIQNVKKTNEREDILKLWCQA